MKLFFAPLALIIANCTGTESTEIHPPLEDGPVYVVAPCASGVLEAKDLDECIQIYANENNANADARPIKEIDEKIRAYSYANRFGVCGEEEVDTLVFIHIVELVKIEKIVRTSSILAYPCIDA